MKISCSAVPIIGLSISATHSPMFGFAVLAPRVSDYVSSYSLVLSERKLQYIHFSVSFQQTPFCFSLWKSNCRFVGQFGLCSWCIWYAALNMSHVFPAWSSLYVSHSASAEGLGSGMVHGVLVRSCIMVCFGSVCRMLSLRIHSSVLLMSVVVCPLIYMDPPCLFSHPSWGDPLRRPSPTLKYLLLLLLFPLILLLWLLIYCFACSLALLRILNFKIWGPHLTTSYLLAMTNSCFFRL